MYQVAVGCVQLIIQ